LLDSLLQEKFFNTKKNNFKISIFQSKTMMKKKN